MLSLDCNIPMYELCLMIRIRIYSLHHHLPSWPRATLPRHLFVAVRMTTLGVLRANLSIFWCRFAYYHKNVPSRTGLIIHRISMSLKLASPVHSLGFPTHLSNVQGHTSVDLPRHFHVIYQDLTDFGWLWDGGTKRSNLQSDTLHRARSCYLWH
jgi:hypothetical protein